MSRLIRSDSRKKPAPEPDQKVQPLTSETIVTHLKACQRLATDYARQAFPVYLEDLDKALDLEIDSARSNQEVAELSGFQRLFRRNRVELERYYCGYIGEGFVKFKKKELHTDLGQGRGEESELSLVDNDELDEVITISTISQRLDTDFAEPIWALNQRLALLNDGEQVTEASNPASPIQFCESLRRAIRLIPLSAKAKTVAYKTYENKLADLVKSVVEDINQYLKKAGVLPNLRYAPPRKTKTHPGPEQAKTAQPNAEQPNLQAQGGVRQPDPNQPTEQYQHSLIQAIRGLQQTMSGGRRASDSINVQTGGAHPMQAVIGGGGGAGFGVSGVGGSTPGVSGLGALGSPGAVVLSSDQLMAALQTLQGNTSGSLSAAAASPAGQGLAPVGVQTLLGALAEQIQQKNEGKDARVSDSDMQTIDLVGLVFEYMLNDENLPASVKALLSYMHTPFLKLAFIDPGFFEQTEHPARMLLNNLAEAGTRWVGNDGTDQFDMYSKIKSIVDRVLRDFKNDVRVITELLLEFNSYTKNIVRRQELMEKRATEKAQGEERLREVKIRVNEEVRQRTDGLELPSAVLLFVLQPWSDYLSFSLLRYGEKSEKWRHALELVDDLFWVIEPKTEEQDLIRQSALASSLLEDIQSGFETIGYDATKGQKLVDAIADLIDLAQQSKKAEPAPAPMRDKLEKIAAEKAGQLKSLEEELSKEEAKVVEQLKMIEFGTWFEFEGGRRLKVAWFNARTSHYMLVDQMGRTVDMKSGIEIAREMISKRAKIIAGSSKPFFERALENIFQKLNAQAEAQSGGENRDQ